MKCDNCTKKECSKKQKNNENQSPTIQAFEHSEEKDGKSEFHRLADAKIFLSDCLACDNCVTAEESLRVAQQNQKELFEVLSLNKRCDTSKHKVLAVSVCPQSLPYLAAQFNLSIADVVKKLAGFLKSLGVHYVFDMTVAADFSILESQRQFIQRYCQKSQDPQALPMFASACPGNKYSFALGDTATGAAQQHSFISCSFLLHRCGVPHTRVINQNVCFVQSFSPDKIYHIIMAPCYDQKLESVRVDSYSSLYNTKDIDCVLTSGEIVQLMEQKNISMKEVEPASLDSVFGETGESGIERHDGRGSDGFLEHIFKYAAKELFGVDVKKITYKMQRNKDFQEVTLQKDDDTVLRFAAAYGFRNIQNLVHKLKKGKFPYHFVEILACPGGCLNGKGQTQSEDGKPDKALLQQMEEAYTSLPVRLPETNPCVQKLYQDWLEGTDSEKVREVLHTQYQAANQTSTSFDIKW
nr:PREDICTED: nuclear prelamin A recognition factor [Latimeria chalumnae]|eukprot:XP_014348419.1 PREDICTED: nuclear prelamin A recognition factor [Latimeria chalumnae]